MTLFLGHTIQPYKHCDSPGEQKTERGPKAYNVEKASNWEALQEK